MVYRHLKLIMISLALHSCSPELVNDLSENSQNPDEEFNEGESPTQTTGAALTSANADISCTYEISGSFASSLCDAMVVMDSGKVVMADSLAKGTSIEWQTPKISTSSVEPTGLDCNLSSSQLTQNCTFDAASANDIIFAAVVSDKNGEKRIESEKLAPVPSNTNNNNTNNNQKKMALVYMSSGVGANYHYVMLTKNTLGPGQWSTPIEFAQGTDVNNGITFPSIALNDNNRIGWAGLRIDSGSQFDLRFGYSDEPGYTQILSKSRPVSRPELAWADDGWHVSAFIEPPSGHHQFVHLRSSESWSETNNVSAELTGLPTYDFLNEIASVWRTYSVLKEDLTWLNTTANDSYFYFTESDLNIATVQGNSVSVCDEGLGEDLSNYSFNEPYSQKDILGRVTSTHVCEDNFNNDVSRLLIRVGLTPGNSGKVIDTVFSENRIGSARAAYDLSGALHVAYEYNTTNSTIPLSLNVASLIGGNWQTAGSVPNTAGYKIVSLHFDENDQMVIIAYSAAGADKSLHEIYKDTGGAWHENTFETTNTEMVYSFQVTYFEQ